MKFLGVLVKKCIKKWKLLGLQNKLISDKSSKAFIHFLRVVGWCEKKLFTKPVFIPFPNDHVGKLD